MMCKDEQSLVCRCEEVTEQEIIEAIENGATTPDAIKKLTRAGMGLCQGKTCRRLIENIIAAKLGKDKKDIRPFTYRAPVRPTKLEELASVVQEDLSFLDDCNSSFLKEKKDDDI